MTQEPQNPANGLIPTANTDSTTCSNRGGKRLGAGRPKNALGKTKRDILEHLDLLGLNLTKEWYLLFASSDDPEFKLKVINSLAPYALPKLKSVEVNHSGGVDGFESLIQVIQQNNSKGKR